MPAYVTEHHQFACGACGDTPRAMLRYVDDVPKCERCGLTYSEPVSARVMRLEREVTELRAFMVAGTNVNDVFAAAGSALGVQPPTTQAETKAERLKANEDKAQREGAEAKRVAWASFSFDVDSTTRLAIVDEVTCQCVSLATWSLLPMSTAVRNIARTLAAGDIGVVHGESRVTDSVRDEFAARGIVFAGVDVTAKNTVVHKAVAAAMEMCITAERRAKGASAERATAVRDGKVLAKLTQMTEEGCESRCYTSGYAAHDIGHAPDVVYALQSLTHAGVVLPPDPPRYGWRLATADKAPAQPLAEGTPVYLAANGKDGTTVPGGTPVGYVIADGGMTVYPRGAPSASAPQAFVKVPASVPVDDEVIGEPKRWTDAEVVAIAAAFGAKADEGDGDAVRRIGYQFGWERDRMDVLRKLLGVPSEPQAPLPVDDGAGNAGRVWAWLTRCDRDDGYNIAAIADGVGRTTIEVERAIDVLLNCNRVAWIARATDDEEFRYRALAPAAGHVIGVEMGDAPVMPAPPQQDTTAALALALLATGRATAPQSVAATMAADAATKQAIEATAPQDETSQIDPPSLLSPSGRRYLRGVAVYSDAYNWCREERLAVGLSVSPSRAGQSLWMLLRMGLVERGTIGDDNSVKHVCWRLTDAGRATLATLPS